MSTISTTITQTVTLGTLTSFPTYDSPLTVTSTGTIVPSTGFGIYAPVLATPPTIDNSGKIEGATGSGVDLLGAGTVINSGTILSPSSAIGTVYIGAGGYVTNSSSGYIGSAGVYIVGAAGTVVNAGRIVDAAGRGVKLTADGGRVTNSGTITGAGGIGAAAGVALYGTGTVTNSGTIRGSTGVFIGSGTLVNTGSIAATSTGGSAYGVKLGAAGSVVNSGTIKSPGSASYTVYLDGGGYLTNSQTGYIGIGGIDLKTAAGTIVNAGRIVDSSGSGILLEAGGTVVDSGTISGVGTAIAFGGTGSNLLILLSGYRLIGSVVGSVSATDTLELSGSLGAVTATFSSLGLTSFEDILFGPGSNKTLKVSNTSGTFGAVISGFTATSDVIDLTAIGTNGSVTQNGTLLTVSGSGGTVTFKLDGSDATAFTVVSDGASGTNLAAACFCRGTMILTDRGEVAVEELAIGDRVATLSGEAKPIKWIGRRSYDGRFIRGNPAVLPIWIKPDALGDGLPARDLYLSPKHALYLDGVLVPAECLINGVSVVRLETVERVEYFNLELAGHDVLYAAGAAAETYVDCDNRGMFQNAAEFALLYPGEAPERWAFCAQRVDEDEPRDAEAIEAVRRKLAERLVRPGWASEGPELRLVVDGRTVQPCRAARTLYGFRLDACPRELRLVSRSAVPSALGLGGDSRRLGVALKRIVLKSPGLTVAVDSEEPSLAEGFYQAEPSHRWTDGDALLPRRFYQWLDGGFELEIEAWALPCYPLTAAGAPPATAEPVAAIAPTLREAL